VGPKNKIGGFLGGDNCRTTKCKKYNEKGQNDGVDPWQMKV